MASRACASCGTTLESRLLRCSRCKSVYYCHVECQKKHWPIHRATCSEADEKRRRVEGLKGVEPKSGPEDDSSQKWLASIDLKGAAGDAIQKRSAIWHGPKHHILGSETACERWSLPIDDVPLITPQIEADFHKYFYDPILEERQKRLIRSFAIVDEVVPRRWWQ